MGYWEQIGEENRKHQEKRNAMHPLLRKVKDLSTNVLLVAISILLWAITLAPIWLLFVR